MKKIENLDFVSRNSELLTHTAAFIAAMRLREKPKKNKVLIQNYWKSFTEKSDLQEILEKTYLKIIY